MILLKILALIIVSDFATGMVHWWEDAYGNPDWKILGKSVVIPNIEHHQFPRKFLKRTFFSRIRLSLLIALFIFIFLSIFSMVSWEIIFILLYSSMANEFHAITHRSDKENGIIIYFLQRIGIIQSRKMHGLHHRSPYNINYCVLTNYLNPILNAIRFWDAIEYIISLIGIKPTRGNTNRGGY